MLNARFRTTTVAAASLMLIHASTAFADCLAGLREATAPEKQHYMRSYAALKDALPAAPPSWTLAVNKDTGLDTLCSDDPQGRFEISVRGFYRYQPSRDETTQVDAERKKIRTEIDALRELPSEVKKERQAWLDKASEANRASNAASKAGNKMLAKQKDDEAEGYSRKGREIRDRYWAGIQPKVDALETKLKALNEGFSYVEVRLSANELFVHSPDPAHSSQITAGKVPSSRSGGLKLQGVRLVLEGPAARRAIIEAAVDRKKLESLLK